MPPVAGAPASAPLTSRRTPRFTIQFFDLTDSNSTSRDMKIYEKLVSLLSLLMEESHSLTSHSSDKSRKRNLQSVKEYIDTHYAEKDHLRSALITIFYYQILFTPQLQGPVRHPGQQLPDPGPRHPRQTAPPLHRPPHRKKIGQECGMSDANYFSRVFKKTEGVAPGEYRKAWRMWGKNLYINYFDCAPHYSSCKLSILFLQ